MSKSNLFRSEDERFISNGEGHVWHARNAIAVDYGFSQWTWKALTELLKFCTNINAQHNSEIYL